ncbi:MAG TPA: arsenite methyltransferase [Burkholderiaceae bacterium]|nr:arsenite methyltransferase [Burkholderiaceae bacterium]
METDMNTAPDLKQVVQQKYGEAAERVARGAGNACCGGAASAGQGDPITSNLYDAGQAGDVPEQALSASLGCGNPTALAELKPGETVLDLGSGGGIDVLLSARRVGPTGTAYGLDMTEQMLSLAEENKRKSGLTNVHFLKGEIEHIPLPANSVDVIISNCVINLSGDKDQVLREAFRVLKPGGRFAVSDVVVRGEVPESIRRSMELWIGCVAGALTESDYLAKLAAAGFESASVEVTRVYSAKDAKEFLAVQDVELQRLAAEVDGKFVSGFVRANKPMQAGAPADRAQAEPAASCCGPRSGCCG